MKLICKLNSIEEKILSKSSEFLLDETYIYYASGVFLILVGAFILPVIQMIRFFVHSSKSCKGGLNHEL